MNQANLVLAADKGGAILNLIRRAFPNVLDFNIQPSYLRQERILGTKSSYEFFYKENRENKEANVKQKLLGTSDMFVIVSSRMLILTREKGENAVPGRYREYTYPNIFGFPSTVIAANDNLNILYNAELALKTGQNTNYPITTKNFYFVPRTQQSLATTASPDNFDQQKIEDGAYNWYPRPVLGGNQDQAFILRDLNTDGLPATGLASVSETADLIVALEHYGYYVFNAAKYVVTKGGYDNLDAISYLMSLPDTSPVKKEYLALVEGD